MHPQHFTPLKHYNSDVKLKAVSTATIPDYFQGFYATASRFSSVITLTDLST
jgi:hypothetical protein